MIELDSAQRVIAKFKPAVQQILTLRTQGHEFPAIGKILGKTADACRMSYNRAIQRIRQLLLPVEVATHKVLLQRSWMTKLKLRYGKNVRFGNGVCHNAPRFSRQTMSKHTDKALLAVSGLISLSILGFAAMSVGRVPQCQTQSYNIGLPIFTVILLSIPFLAGLSARGLLNKGVNPSPKRFTQKRYKPSDSSSKSALKGVTSCVMPKLILYYCHQALKTTQPKRPLLPKTEHILLVSIVLALVVISRGDPGMFSRNWHCNLSGSLFRPHRQTSQAA